MRYAALTALALLAPAGLNAQQVRKDPATGHYYVTVYDDDLQPVEILVESAGLVEYSVSAGISPTASGLHYTYVVTVQPQSRQALSMYQFDCPRVEAAIRDLSAIRLNEGDRLWTDRGEWATLPTCYVEFGARPLGPGSRMRAEFESSLLPAIGESRGIGKVHGVSWPALDVPENDAAVAFVDSVQGFTGGWKSVPTVVPARDPALLDDPAGGLRLVHEDLARTCGDLAWITNAGVCHSLQTKLEQAARAVERGRREAARSQLTAFLQELEAQHGPEPGKHVGDNAYWLLRVNVAYLLERL